MIRQLTAKQFDRNVPPKHEANRQASNTVKGGDPVGLQHRWEIFSYFNRPVGSACPARFGSSDLQFALGSGGLLRQMQRGRLRSAADAEILPDAKPCALCQLGVVSAICRRDVAFGERLIPTRAGSTDAGQSRDISFSEWRGSEMIRTGPTHNVHKRNVR